MTKQFKAKVLDASMNISFIDVEAVDDSEARRFIAAAGHRLMHLKQSRGPRLTTTRQKPFNLMVFNQQLYSLLEAGQTIVDAIEVLGRNDKRGHHRSIFDTLLRALHEGCQLSEAMQKLPSAFPVLYIAMVKASETTGTVKNAIQRFTQYQTQVNEIRSKLVAAATYPAILLSVGFLVISFLLLYVLPRFSAIYDDTNTANATVGFVQAWGTFVRNNTALAWLSLLGILVLIVTLVVHPGIRLFLSKKILTAPWIGEKVWILQMARMYRTLGMLLKSGVSVLTAMRMTQASLPPSMKKQLEVTIQEVSEGHPISDVLMRHGLSTEIAQRLLVAGESSGNLDDMMERIADFYDQETSMWIDAAGRLIEPLLMVGIGLIVGVVVLMLYSPIFDLANIV